MLLPIATLENNMATKEELKGEDAESLDISEELEVKEDLEVKEEIKEDVVDDFDDIEIDVKEIIEEKLNPPIKTLSLGQKIKSTEKELKEGRVRFPVAEKPNASPDIVQTPSKPVIKRPEVTGPQKDVKEETLAGLIEQVMTVRKLLGFPSDNRLRNAVQKLNEATAWMQSAATGSVKNPSIGVKANAAKK